MIKYLGSKRKLVPVLGAVADAVGATTAVDLFTGTTRVAQELKRRGIHTTAVDLASYSAVLSDCFVATDAADVDEAELADALEELDALPGRRGYFTATFCEQSRFLRPENGRRVDADPRRHRGALGRLAAPPAAPHQPAHGRRPRRLDHRRADGLPEVLGARGPSAPCGCSGPRSCPGPGRTVHDDALAAVADLDPVDLMYLDPPYNHHRYFTNYHVWETLVRWDAPEHYGVACKRVDAREESTRSVFNRKADMPAAVDAVIQDARADVVVVSYNDESWITAEQMTRSLRDAGHERVGLLAFDSTRYVGAKIGIHGPDGTKVGSVSHLRNTELVFVAGAADRVEAALAAGSLAQPLEPPPARDDRAGHRCCRSTSGRFVITPSTPARSARRIEKRRSTVQVRQRIPLAWTAST